MVKGEIAKASLHENVEFVATHQRPLYIEWDSRVILDGSFQWVSEVSRSAYRVE